MSRIYEVATENVAVSAAQDLLQIKGASGKMLRIKRVKVGASDTSIPTAQMLRLRCRFLPTTVTDGSGGSTPTPQKRDPGDAGASFTALGNNSTQATTNGTALVVDQPPGIHIYAGYDYAFPAGMEPVIGPSESFTFEMLSTPSGTLHLSSGVTVEEIGG
jgi:hypothetical protein